MTNFVTLKDKPNWNYFKDHILPNIQIIENTNDWLTIKGFTTANNNYIYIIYTHVDLGYTIENANRDMMWTNGPLYNIQNTFIRTFTDETSNIAHTSWKYEWTLYFNH